MDGAKIVKFSVGGDEVLAKKLLIKYALDTGENRRFLALTQKNPAGEIEVKPLTPLLNRNLIAILPEFLEEVYQGSLH